MNIRIKRPLAFSKLGQRDNNEDFIFPLVGESTKDSKLFIVCDGMGGLDKGELASKIVAKEISAYLENTRILNYEILSEAVVKANKSLEKELVNDPLISRMGSTLALVYFNSNTVFLAHIGDSRIYHLRNEEILYKSKDHKQVLDMVENGIISEEQAESHPWRNRLSKSIATQRKNNTNSKDFNYDMPTVMVIEDLSSDDYFFICTDGVLEQLTDNDLCRIVAQELKDNSSKMEEILSICERGTKDNYSAYLIQIESFNTEEKDCDLKSSKKTSNLFKKLFFLSILFFAIAIGGPMLYKHFKSNTTRSLPNFIQR